MRLFWVLLAVAPALLGCGQAPESGEPKGPEPTAQVDSLPEGGARVVVVANRLDPSSLRIAAYYASRRGVPDGHLVEVSAPLEEEVSLDDYRTRIERPVREALDARGLTALVDFIVLVRGVPLRIREGGYSVDAFLAAMDLDLEPIRSRDPGNFRHPTNPYFGKNAPFRRRDYGFYLVTRLDGTTPEDAMRLVDSSVEGRPRGGPFLLDVDPRYASGGYAAVNRSMVEAARILRIRGMQVILEETNAFSAGPGALAGYYSWGSNDGSYDSTLYRSIRFLPGAIAETAVSTSARTFRPTTGGQSLVADLIAAGVTGVKGYVSEPLTVALCPASILFDRWTAGYTLAESFYMATPFLKWKDVVIGDPLCAPYRKEQP